MNVERPVLILDRAATLHHGALGIARSLGRLGVPVHVATPDPDAAAARSRFMRGRHKWPPRPDSADDASAEALVQIGTKIGRPLLCPVSDLSTVFVEDYASTLAEAFEISPRPEGLVEKLCSKQGLHDLCLEHGIPTPRAAFPTTPEEALEHLGAMEFPVVLKPVDATYQPVVDVPRTIIAGDRAAALDALAAYGGRAILQEYVPGGAESVWMFNGYFDATGACLIGITGQKLRQFPATGGVTSLGLCINNDEVVESTVSLMQRIGYTGILDCGYRYDARDGKYKMLDVNPRIGSSFRLFVDSAGTDVARTWYADATGQPVVTGERVDGRRWIVEDFDLVSLFQEHGYGLRAPLTWLRSLPTVDEAAWFAKDDIRPLLHLGRSRVRAAGRRLRR